MSRLTAWRIGKTKYSKKEAFSGYGGVITAGRWHFPGTHIVYTSDSLALATLEIFVNQRDNLIFKRYNAYRIQIPETIIENLDTDTISEAGEVLSPHHMPKRATTQILGDSWIESGTSAVLSVPSAIICEERNFLLNPRHNDFEKVVIDDGKSADFDQRLFWPLTSYSAS